MTDQAPDLFKADEAAEAARLARFDLAFKLQGNVKATLLDPENLRLDELTGFVAYSAAEDLVSEIVEAMAAIVAPERSGSDLRESVEQVAKEAADEIDLAGMAKGQIKCALLTAAKSLPLEEIAARIAREIAQRAARDGRL